MHAPQGSNPDFNNFLEEGSALQNDDLYGTDPENNYNEDSLNRGFELPKIQTKNKAPFKGFADLSVVSHRLRRTVGSEGGKKGRNNSATVEGNFVKGTIQEKIGLKDHFKKAAKNKTTMSP